MKFHSRKLHLALNIGALLLALVSACGPATPAAEPGRAALEPVSLIGGEKLHVVATTNIVGDVVKKVGGDQIELTILMAIGVDPHTYIPTPADTAAVHEAHLVLANGAGLEQFLEEMLANAGGNAVEVHLSEGIELRALDEGHGEESGEHAAEGDDPHVWFSVPNVIHWVAVAEQALSSLDPANAQVYQQNAEAYTRELEALDAWIAEQVGTIPPANRRLVTNHPVFGYFADRYGLEQVGEIYPVSPSAEPSAQDVAALEDAIRKLGVPAVFAESTVNPKLAQQVADDTGVKLVPLYTGSLGGPDSGAETYIELMRYDVRALVEALQ